MAVLLAALPLQAVAETPSVSISVDPPVIGRYSSTTEGQQATFTITRMGDNSNALEVNYTTSAGGGPAGRHYENAVEGDDYTAIPKSHKFPAGGSTTHEFSVTINDDDPYEPEQYFTVTATGIYQDDQGNTVEFSEKVVVRIRENDERYLTLSPVSNSDLVAHLEFKAKEGGINGTDNKKNELTIKLNDTLPYDLRIEYTVGDDPYTTAAASANDFTMKSPTAIIPSGEESVKIDIGIVDDMRVEPTEYFTLDFRAPTHEDPGNALGTFNPVTFQDSKLPSQPLSVSIMDNDTAIMGGIVYLRGEGPSGHSVIDKFPSTRRTITEGQSTIITAEIAGAAPANDTQIPLKVIGFPSNEVTPADYSIPSSITIEAGKKSGEVTLTITNDTEDERYRELLVVEIDDAGNFPTGYTKGDRSKYEVIMLDNDETPTNLTGPTLTALTEDRNGTTMATFQLSIDRRPKADPTEDPPFTGADTKEVDAKLVLGYTGKATRGTDYKLTPNNLSSNSGIVIRKSPAAPPDGCSLDGEVVTCTVTLTVQDDNLYEGGVNTKENVKIDLDTGKSSFSGGIKKPTGLSLTIEDNDLQPMFSIADVSGPENGNLTFTVKREGARGNNVSVTAGTGSHSGATNSAIADTDYTTESQKLDFGRDNTTQTFEVAITDDNIDEPDKETFAVTLSNPVDNQGLPKPAIAAGKGTAVGTIEDNDDTPTELTISVNTGDKTDYNLDTIAEAAGKTTVSVTATIDSPTRFATDQTVTVTVGNDENEGEARKGDSGDYEAVDELTITIPATEASGKGTFDLTPVNDDIDDDGEMISVEGALAGMTVTHATITIVDDDTRGITVVSGEMAINEADDTSTSPQIENTSSYGVKLTSQPEGGTVTVNVAIKDATVAKVNTSSLVFDAQNWEHTQLVIVTAQDDTIDNTGDKRTTTITHTVSAAGTDYADETVEDVVTVTVRDDDEAPTALTIALDTDTSTEDIQSKVREGVSSPTVRITATLDGDTQFATDQTIAIIVGDSDKDTATEGEGGDYASVDEFHITLLAGDPSVSHDLTLTLNDDSVDEPDETVTVAGELAGVTVTDTMFAIEDNDDTPTVTLVLTPASINESGETNASTATATMDGTSSEAVTLTVSATSVSPAVASDFTLSDNKTLAIPANTQASNGVVTITAVDNDVDAADKTVTVAATATGGNALVQAPGNQTLTITDDDTRGITVSKATLTLDEEDNTATMEAVEHQDTYTVVLDSEPSGGTVTIGVASDDANIARVAPATLTFTASNWDETQTVTVTAVLDGIDNPNDRRTAAITHTVTATGTDYDGATASGVTVTVNDDDGAPTLSINSPSVTEVDSGAAATLTFTVQLLPKSGNTVTVAYADAGTGTATSGGTDYATLVGGTLTFNPDDTSKPVAVTVSGDDIDELDETVVVRLSSPSNATLPGGATTLDGTGTITDNDPTPTVSVADAMAVSEGNVASPDPANNITFAVTLSAISGLEVTVPYTLSGTATAGTDYTEPDPRSVTIAAGETQVNIAIPVAGDEVDEENETITVTLGEPTNATVSTVEGAGTGSGTITDDDTRGVSVTPTALTVEEADDTNTATTREDQETYKVVLTSQPTGAVTVNLNSGDESVARIDTASLVFDADDWKTERTVTVTGQADVIDNKDDQRTTNITHTVSAAVTDYEDETAKSVAVTVTDDDAAPSGITLTASPDSVTENGGGKTITVTAAVNDATRYADAKTVTVSVGGGTAISGTDYSVVESFDITIGAGEDDASNTFTLTPTNDVLAEGNETIDVTGTLSGITITPDAITLNDDDAAPTGITLSVDTNGAEDGTPSTVAEDAGATVVTVTATVNGTTRYVDAKTVVVSVADGTAASPADYAAVSNFSITIAAGAASHTGNFTVTPVDDDLDESNETIDVTGTLSSVTVTKATVTFTDTDDPVSFSIADAEATEGGKVTFTVSRAGAGDNVVSVKIATAADSGDDVNAASTSDYTAIATAQTLNFAKGVASQTVEVQTTQDDLFEPDETFKAVLSAPALADGDPGTGVSIESGKGTAIGTITNDDTEPSFAVADASASEGDAITFTVTRSGAMDNAVSVKWNTKAATGAGAASTTDYTAMTTATQLDFAKGVSRQTFTVATTEDVLHEGNETFLVELTEPAGGTIATAEATGTINDDDAAPTGITLTVSPATVGEGAGETEITVTATVNGTTRYVDAKTVVVSVADGTAASPADYAAVSNFNITIAAGGASHTGNFTVTPVDDDLDESNETIDVTGTLSSVTITGATVTFTDTDDPVSFSIADAEATEGGKVTFTVNRAGAEDNVASVKIATAADSGDDVNAASTSDYTAIATAQTLNFAKGVASQTVEVQTTQDDLFEPDETFKAVLSAPALADGDPGTGVSIESGKGTAIGTITNDDTEPSFAVADASASEGDAITFTVTRSGAMDNAVSVKWNTKAATGAGAASTTDYTAMTTATQLDFAKGVSRQTFTVATTEDVLHEGNETFLVELTEAVGGTITDAEATGTITDDDDAPSGITLSVDTNGSTAGTPSTVAEDAGATVVTVTATVNGTTRYVEAQTVEVSVADGTAASPADYAAVSNFNITIAAGGASQTGSFTVTPVDDDLDESNETIDVTGTLSSVTVTKATVTFTDTDDPVSFSIADAEATEGGKVTFTVSRAGAGDNVVSVKIATAADSGDDVNAASTSDYTAIATAQTLNFAKGVASQTVEVQTTQDDLFEPDETFKAVLSAPALADGDPGTGVSIESGKGTAIGTITNDDTEPSFAVADASASEGDAITFTVTRSGAMDNAVSVKWNTKAATGAGAASTTDYTAMTTATQLDFAKGVSRQTFTVATTEDVLHEGNETFLVELTEPAGGTIATAEATGTINDDDAAPTGITLTVSPATVGEGAGETEITVTATVNGTTRYVDAKTVVVSVADGTAASPADYAAVSNFNITIAAGGASHTGNFTVTPVDDDLDESNETIDVTGTLSSVTITGATVTFTDTDDPVSFSIADAEATEGGKVTFTVNRAGAEDNVASVKIATAADSGDDVNAASTSDYTAIATAQTLNFAKGVASQTVEVQTTQDDLFEPDETFKAVLSAPALADGDPGTGVSIESGKGTAIGTITNDDTEPSFAVADASASEGDAITFTVTRSGAMDNVVSVKWNTKADSSDGANAASASDYTAVTAARPLTFAKGAATQTFTVATTEDNLDEDDETFLVELTEAVGGTITDAEATGTITDDDDAPSGITLSVDTNGSTAGTPSTVAEDAGATVVTVTATVNGTTRYVEAQTVEVSVADGTAASPADYAAVSNFNITIAAGGASQTGSFTVTPVDDDLDESNETIDVTGTLSSVTVTKATVTFTDTDDPVSFSIADAEATEGGKVTFTVSRAGAGDNVVSVKIATAADSGDDVNAASTSDYTAIATAQTLNFAKGVASQTVEVQTTQDDLFEPDETFKAVLSAPALADGDPGTGVSIESGKGTAIGTITNDDTEPSFAVADASASEGDAITFTVTRSGAMDNAVSVKWNTKAATGAGAASTTDYTAMTTATQLDFAKGVSRQTFTVATTEDVLHEGNETFLVELTEPAGGTIATAEATGTINDDDAAPTGITLTVSPATVGEGAGETEITVTATVNGTTRYVDAKTVTVSVGGGTAISGTDYVAVANFDITIAAGDASKIGTFDLTPKQDELHEGSETINLDGTLTGVTVTDAMITLTDDDGQPSFAVADASANEGDAITFTVTRSGAMDNVVSVKWNTKADSSDGANAASASDYTAVTAARPLTFAKGAATQTFTVATTEDNLDEDDETFLVELTEAVGGTITDAEATGTITDDDDAPSGITLSVDTNGSTAGTPSTVAEDAGATVVTVTATVNGTTRYVEAQTVEVSVADGTAASPADYAAVSNFNITIAAGGASQTGSFTVTPVDDDLDESNETIDVTGTLSSVTVTKATVTFTDTDDPVSFSIADAEATEGGKVTFTVSRAGAGDNVVSVKIATAADSGDDVNAASTSDYTAIATAQTLNFAKGVASQTVEVQTTQDDLFEPDETFKAVLSAPALADGDPGTGVSIESGKGTAIGTITNDDTEPSFAVADASASEGDAITFTVTRSGAMDNAVSVKWNTKAATGAGAASTTDYTAMTTATQLDFAKGVSRQTFTVATTEDVLHEGNETFLVELTEPAGGTIATAEATGTINDDDAAPTGITLTVSPATVGEGAGETEITVTATVNGTTRYVDAKTVTVSVGGGTAISGTDYVAVANFDITIAAGDASKIGTFDLTPKQDELHEGSETINLDGTLTGVTVTDAMITLTDDDGQPSFAVADASANEGDAITFTVTRSGAMDNVVSVKWNTKADSSDGANAASASDYTAVTAARPLTFAKGAATQTFTVATTEDNLDEDDETFLVELTEAVGGTITDAEATGTITDDDDAPSGITLSVDTNGSTAGTPSTVAEDAGATVVTVTATVNGTTRYVEAQTVEVSVADGTAASPADYAAVSNFNITIAAGGASQTGSFTVTPVDDDLDESNETIDVTGTLSSVTVTKATVTFTDTDDPVSFSIADAEATEGGKVTFTVSRAGAGDNVVSVKIATAADSGDDVNAASTSDYTAIATAQTLNFAKGVASQTVEVQTTQDDLFEPDETFKAVLSAPALADGDPGTGVSIESGKGTAIGTITNDDTEPSFAVADASASEGDAITFTVTRSGAMDNAVSVKWNTKAATGAGAASTTDYTAMTTATQLDFAKGVSRQTFTVATTEDVLHEGNETFLVELTEPAGGTIATAEATGTINDDDAAPTGITLTVSPATVGEGAGETEITVTATVNGTTRYVDAKTVTVSVGGGTAISGTDYVAVANFDITIAAGDASKIGTFDLTPKQDELHEGSETINLDGTLTGVTVTDTMITLTDDDGQPSFSVADASADEGDAITFTVTRSGAMDNAVSVKWNTKADSSDGAGAASTSDYTVMTTATKLDFAKGVSSQTFTVATTEDNLHEVNETFLVELTEPVGAIISDAEATGTITDDDALPTALTLSVDADTDTNNVQTSLAEDGGAKMVRVTASLGGSSTFTEAKTVAVEVGADADGATEGMDYANVETKNITINAGASSGYVDFQLTPTNDDIDEPDEGISIEGTLASVTVTGTSLTITDDEGTPTVTLVLTPSTINESGNGNASTVTATLSGESSTAVTVEVSVPNNAPVTVSGNTTLTIVAGSKASTGAVTITAVDNDIDAPNKTVTVSATASGGGVANPGNQTLTITDDEGIPTATLVLTPTMIDESGATNASTVTATLSGKSNTAVTLTVAAAAGADTASGDFTVTANKTLTIAAGATTSTGAVTITAVDNDVDAPNKTVTVSATASGGGVANPGNQTLTITDDEGTPTVTLVLTPSTINESGNGNASTVTATLSGESSTAVTVEVSVPNNAPVTVSGNTTLTIVAGSKASTGAVTITAVDNDIDAPNKTVTVSATASGGGVANPGNQTLTITDDEGIPTATLVLTPTMIDESGATNASTVTATLSGKSNTAVTLTVAAAAGADTASGDFTVTANKTLTIAAGATTSTGAVTITAVDNNVDAPNKTVTVSATASGGVADPTNQTLTIKDDDDVPSSITLSVSPATVVEANGAKMVRVTVTLVGSTFTEAKTVTLDVGADADSAEKGTDYTTVEQQSIKINAGAASGYVEFKLTPMDDTLHEGNETISLEGTLADETLADVTVTDATITLTDDDAAPTGITLTVSPATVDEGAGETEITVTATVNGTTRYVDAKTVTVSVGGGKAISGTDYDAVSNFDITIAAGEASKAGTFDLTPMKDDLHEGNETINLDGTLTGVTVTDTMITLTDDDGQPSFSVADASADEGDAITFTVTRSGAMDNAVSVKWNTKAATGAGAASTSDYTVMTTATKLDFAKGVSSQTFTVATTEDNLHEVNETFLVELTEPVGAIISDAEATGTITDDDALPTALTLSVDADTDTNNVQTSLAEDGGAKMVRVTASLGGSSTFNVAKTVAVEVGADADGATEGTDYTNVGTQNITINAGASSGYVEFTLTPINDDIDEPNEGISIEGTLASVTVTGTSLTITDDEATPTATLVLTPATINESGETNASTVTAMLSGESSAPVTVTVSVPNDAPVTLSTNTTLTIAAGSKASTGAVTITAVDNDVDAPNASVVVSGVASGGGVANPVIETLTINDDDVAPTGITLTVSPATIRETDGETEITVTATVNGTTRYADAKTVTVSVSDGTATSGMDYDAVSNFDIIIAAGDTSNTGTFDLMLINDAVQEKDETIEITGSSGALNITKAMITITNSDPMPAAWLGRFGRTVAEQALDGIAGRIAASRSAGVQGSIAGHALNFDSPYSGSEALPRLDPRAGAGGTGVESSTTNDTTTLNNLVNNNVQERSELTLTSGDGGTDAFDTDGQTSRSYTLTAREMLLGSSFTATGEKDVSGGSLASWGRTAQSSFDGREGTLSLDGEATTTMLGVDYARDHWLVGMALMQSNGKGGYQDSETELRASSPACSTTENGTEQGTCNGAVRDGEGEVEATLTAVTPYAAIQTSENLKLWGTLGHGTGEVTLTPEVGDPLKADISWTMAAVGLRSDIIVPRKNSTELGPLSDSGLALALTADALWARTSSNRTQDMVASDSDVTRLRLGLEGSYQITLKQGGSVTPRLEVGVRQDGGSAETGLGIELVGGLSWLDPTRGLSIDLSGRTLIVHSSDDLKNQSFAVAFAWDPDPATQRGPSLKFSQQWGTIALGGLDTPFGPDSIEDLGDSENTARWQADAAWGFPIFGGSFTGSPHVGVGLASDTRDYSLGWRLTPAANANAPDLSFAVKATRQESDTAPPEHSIGFVLIFRW